ncbi:HNH endonuclease [Streptomyces phage Samisti12]|uniref:HNH endonuclease n=1 Tax=Streptomyces phage Samisti12 TaxID=2023995 RepID=A0A223FZW8_9CAUD|nr:HNH endonuclease [Streptomyces phage Samisti12]AST15299.1 HNH endonuclease [Streptomyces phage Samisti12]
MYRPIRNWHNRKRIISDDGYVLVFAPEHPKSFNGGWYYEHRMVFEARLGRLLDSTETVHHIGCKTDNTRKNLFLCSWEEHERLNRQEALTRR